MFICECDLFCSFTTTRKAFEGVIKYKDSYSVTRRVVVGRSKYCLFRPETTLLVTLYALQANLGFFLQTAQKLCWLPYLVVRREDTVVCDRADWVCHGWAW